MERHEAARLLGSLPKARRHERACPVCGAVFLGTERAKFCSPHCKARDQTRRKTAERRARREQEQQSDTAGKET